MKKIFYMLLSSVILISCNDDFDIADQGFDLENLPESVAFDGAGNTSNANATIAEGATRSVVVEAPAGTEDDIIVTYSLSGTATYGADYTIAGATASGGTVTITRNTNFAETDRGTIPLVTINDVDVESSETVIITLVSATRNGEAIAVGRGGTTVGLTATITITSND